MKIMQNYSKNQPTFQSVNLIQVSKGVFEHTDDVLKVCQNFDRAIRKSEKGDNICSFLEQPLYAAIMERLKLIGNYSIDWLTGNARIPVKKPINPNYHSFYVCTGKQKKVAEKLFGISELIKLEIYSRLENIQRRFHNNFNLCSGFSCLLKMNNELSRKFAQKIQGEPVHMFKLESLSELPKVLEQIEYQ